MLKNIIITRTIKDKLRLKWNAIGGERKEAGQGASPPLKTSAATHRLSLIVLGMNLNSTTGKNLTRLGIAHMFTTHKITPLTS